jgi:hypothetical protein
MPQIAPLPSDDEQDLIERGMHPDRAWSIALFGLLALTSCRALPSAPHLERHAEGNPQVVIDDVGKRPTSQDAGITPSISTVSAPSTD